MYNRYFIRLSFNGANYHGWQIQENSITVQEVVDKGLSLLLNVPVQTTGCGRTDTGVHSHEFYAHFDIDKVFTESELKELVSKINHYLPVDIAVHDIVVVNNNAHARFDAVSRTYKYYVSRTKDVFNTGFSYYVYGDLDVSLMNKGATFLFNYNDFSCFSKSHTQVKTNICKIYEASWNQVADKLVFTITADRFLRNMVRAIVGTLLELGQKKITLDDLNKIIESKNRSQAGASVPACGLFLSEVKYPEELFQ